jgi:hypothetical protein
MNYQESDFKDKIDELFSSIGTFKKSFEFMELLDFCSRFRYLSPYNAMLVKMQRPGASFVSTANGWRKNYNLKVKQSARPLIILIPFGPVDYVFDIEDVEGASLNLIPDSILHPFKTSGKLPANLLKQLVFNLKYFGIKLEYVDFGSQQQARIERLLKPSFVALDYKFNKQAFQLSLPQYYLISINRKGSDEDVFAGIVHELAHFFCYHLPPFKFDLWKQRNHLNRSEIEFEAETIAWLVCERLGVKNPSEKYLAFYIESNDEIPSISLEHVLKATNTIESLFGNLRLEDCLLGKKDDNVIEQLQSFKKSQSVAKKPKQLSLNI